MRCPSTNENATADTPPTLPLSISSSCSPQIRRSGHHDYVLIHLSALTGRAGPWASPIPLNSFSISGNDDSTQRDGKNRDVYERFLFSVSSGFCASILQACLLAC